LVTSLYPGTSHVLGRTITLKVGEEKSSVNRAESKSDAVHWRLLTRQYDRIADDKTAMRHSQTPRQQ